MTTHAPERAVARWRALGCTVHLETEDPGELEVARALVSDVLADVDAVASRFRDDSDLTWVNQHPGRWVQVDPLLVHAVRIATSAAARTGGLVHPLLAGPLVELGYDATFTTVAARRPDPAAVTTYRPAPPPLDSWSDIGLRSDAVRVPLGTALDLGATAKAWCTDLAVAALGERLTGRAVVSIGGDLRTVHGAWEVGIAERPIDDVDAAGVGGIEELVQVEGALATSSTCARRWTTPAGARHHHLIDPRTGGPAREHWRTVTVLAPTCVSANVASTAAVVLAEDAVDWLTAELDADRLHAARLVRHDGTLHRLGPWPGPREA